ncbi:hypothetical protein CGRA01v4_00026 [Colletotrichum graminicola]|nr:hypothetical protein CGRA01v4_00026 [Colletotrichum graminicola]
MSRVLEASGAGDFAKTKKHMDTMTLSLYSLLLGLASVFSQDTNFVVKRANSGLLFVTSGSFWVGIAFGIVFFFVTTSLGSVLSAGRSEQEMRHALRSWKGAPG